MEKLNAFLTATTVAQYDWGKFNNNRERKGEISATFSHMCICVRVNERMKESISLINYGFIDTEIGSAIINAINTTRFANGTH